VLGTAWAVFYGLQHAIPAYIFWHYRGTYRQVDFVMGAPEPNEGSPLVRGRLEPDGVEWVMGARATAAGYVLESDPAVVIEPGRHVRVWWSDAAPVVGFPGGSTRIMPVSTMPRLPRLGRTSAWVAGCLLAVLAGAWVMGRQMFRPRTWGADAVMQERRGGAVTGGTGPRPAEDPEDGARPARGPACNGGAR
jgi:hypothetical protein